MDTGKILTYLTDLEQNNNREWYHAHKVEYQQANTEFEALITALILSVGQTDSHILHNNPKELTFKLVRDTRFSKDKSPYNPAFRAHISSAGKLPIPVGYYICIRPGDCSFIGGGLFASMFKDATTMVRDHISANGAEFQRIISDKAFQDSFTVMGEALKNVPTEYEKEHEQALYLKYKSWYLEYPMPDSLIADPDRFVKLATEKFVLMQPFNAFLNTALRDFTMPER